MFNLRAHFCHIRQKHKYKTYCKTVLIVKFDSVVKGKMAAAALRNIENAVLVHRSSDLHQFG